MVLARLVVLMKHENECEKPIKDGKKGNWKMGFFFSLSYSSFTFSFLFCNFVQFKHEFQK